MTPSAATSWEGGSPFGGVELLDVDNTLFAGLAARADRIRGLTVDNINTESA